MIIHTKEPITYNEDGSFRHACNLIIVSDCDMNNIMIPIMPKLDFSMHLRDDDAPIDLVVKKAVYARNWENNCEGYTTFSLVGIE